MRKQALVGLLAGALIVAVPGGVISAKDQPTDACKDGGWEELVRGDGTPFANQGACVAYVAGGGTAEPPSTFASDCHGVDGIFYDSYVVTAEPLFDFQPYPVAPACVLWGYSWDDYSQQEYRTLTDPFAQYCSSTHPFVASYFEFVFGCARDAS